MKSWKEQFTESASRRSAEVAHDLKTPLNVAVLNLELARMKARKLAETDDDEKISNYLKAVEAELRRIARIFDAYFVYAVPPGDEAPELVEPTGMAQEFLQEQGVPLIVEGEASVRMHPERIRPLMGNLIGGALAVLVTGSASARAEVSDAGFRLTLRGTARRSDEELSKIFKFYYTDADGNPELGLATARLIAESYAGTVESRTEHDELLIELTLPVGEE